MFLLHAKRVRTALRTIKQEWQILWPWLVKALPSRIFNFFSVKHTYTLNRWKVKLTKNSYIHRRFVFFFCCVWENKKGSNSQERRREKWNHTCYNDFWRTWKVSNKVPHRYHTHAELSIWRIGLRFCVLVFLLYIWLDNSSRIRI